MKTAGKQRIIPYVYGFLGICFVCILVLLPMHAFISTWGGTTIGPLLVWKSWKELLLLALIPIILLAWYIQPAAVHQLFKRPINWLIIVYILLHLLLSVISSASSEAIIAGLLMNLRFLVMFLLAQLLIVSNLPWAKRLKTWLPTWLLWTMVGLSIMAILQVFVLPKDFLSQFGYEKGITIAPFVLVDDNPDALRAFATMRGPNTLGAFLLLPLAVALYCLFTKRAMVISSFAFVLGCIALLLTGSRSAWLGFIAVLVILLVLLLPRAYIQLWLRRLAIPLILIAIVLSWAAVSVPVIRLAVFHSSPTDSHLFEGSSEAHGNAVVAGMQDVLAHPLGQGPGSAGPASFYNDAPTKISENYFVQIAQEVGLLGLVLFVLISLLVGLALLNQTGMIPAALLASFIGINVINLFLHGWADDPTAMIWWGLAGLYYENTNKKKR